MRPGAARRTSRWRPVANAGVVHAAGRVVALRGAIRRGCHTLDTLRAPRRKGQPSGSGAGRTPIRPVVFEDQGSLDAPAVHLHLEHRFVQRLLGRFRSQGFVHNDLARACVGVDRRPGASRHPARAAVAVRRERASRLHDEVARGRCPLDRCGHPQRAAEALRRGARSTRRIELLERRSASKRPRELADAGPPPARVRRAARSRGAEAVTWSAQARRAHTRSRSMPCRTAATKEATEMRAILEAQRARISRPPAKKDKEAAAARALRPGRA